MARSLNEIADDLAAAHRSLQVLAETVTTHLGGEPAQAGIQLIDESGREISLSALIDELRAHPAA